MAGRGTVIDSLVVELGLDPKKFTQGQREAIASAKRANEELTQQGKKQEDAIRRQDEALTKLKREAIGLFALFAGASGIKQFIGNIVGGDAALGRFSRSAGIATGDAVKLVKAFELAGGKDGQSGIASLNNQIQDFRAGLGGNILPLYNQIAAEGGTVIDINKTITEQLLTIAKNARAIEAKTPGRGGFFLRQLGFGEDAIAMLLKGNEYLQGMIDKAEQLGAATQKDTDAAERLVAKYNELNQTISGLARPAEEWATKAFDSANNFLLKLKEFQDSVTAGDPNKTLDKNPAAAEMQLPGANIIPGILQWYRRILGFDRAGPDKPPGDRTKPFTTNELFPPVPAINFRLPQAPAGAGISAQAGGLPGTPSGGDINVTGPINVYTQATDAAGVARELKSSLERLADQRRTAMQANGGGQ